MPIKLRVAYVSAIVAALLAIVLFRAPSRERAGPSTPSANVPLHDHRGADKHDPATTLGTLHAQPAQEGWRATLSRMSATLAEGMPEPALANLQQALNGCIRRHERVTRVDGEIRSWEWYEPTSPLERTYFIESSPTDYVARIDAVLLGALNPQNDQATVRQLLEILESPDDCLGNEPHHRKLFVFVRWRAAKALRGHDFASDSRERLISASLSHPDPVLRGAAASALLALKGRDDDVSVWLARERDDRALQALLLELRSHNLKHDFAPGAPVGLKEDGTLVSGDRSKMTERLTPVSGADMVLDVLRLVSDQGLERQTRQDALEALHLRVDATRPELFQHMARCAEVEVDGEVQMRLLAMLRKFEGPIVEATYVKWVSDTRLASTVRAAVVYGFVNQKSDTAKRILSETVQRDADDRVRMSAAMAVMQGHRDLLPVLRAEIVALIEAEKNVALRGHYNRLLQLGH